MNGTLVIIATAISGVAIRVNLLMMSSIMLLTGITTPGNKTKLTPQ